MNGPMHGETFLYMWIGFLLLMICCIAGFFLWAVRARQFGDQERARYLALYAAIPDQDEKDAGPEHGRGLP